jgi:hypothetical protein
LTDVAVKIMADPWQMVVAEAVILTAGVTSAFTVIIIELDVAFAALTQLSLEVSSQVTTSPFARLLLE